MALVYETDKSGNAIEIVDFATEEYRLPTFERTPEEIRTIFENVPNFRCRDDDVMICSYPKTGTNWIYEVTCMILRRKAERIKERTSETMIECFPEEEIQKVQRSPRVLNTHLNYRYLPKDLKSKKLKTILIVRNPKDTLVSFYNYHNGIRLYHYSGRWEDWLPLYLTGKLDYGLYDQYLVEWADAIKAGPGFPLHVIYYEDLKDILRLLSTSTRKAVIVGRENPSSLVFRGI